MDFRPIIRLFFWHVVFIAILLIVLTLMSCSHGRTYRIYIHDAHRGLFIRDLKNKDVLSYKEGHGLLCMPEEDVKKLMEEVSTKKAYGR